MNVEDKKLLIKLYYRNNESVTDAIRKFKTRKNIRKKEKAPRFSTVADLLLRNLNDMAQLTEYQEVESHQYQMMILNLLSNCSI